MTRCEDCGNVWDGQAQCLCGGLLDVEPRTREGLARVLLDDADAPEDTQSEASSEEEDEDEIIEDEIDGADFLSDFVVDDDDESDDDWRAVARGTADGGAKRRRASPVLVDDTDDDDDEPAAAGAAGGVSASSGGAGAASAERASRGGAEHPAGADAVPAQPEPANSASANPMGRRWMVTLNHPQHSDDEYKTLMVDLPKFRGAVFQRERGVTGATEHLQMYIECTAAVRFTQISAFFLGRAHCELARKPKAACIKYCSKEETRVSGPYTVGDMTISQGKRTDLKEAADMVIAGKPLRDVARAKPETFVQFSTGLYRLQRELGQGAHPTHMPRTNWLFYGPTRCGKSWKARADCPKAYVKTPDQWFEFYDGETESIFDDFGASWALPLATLLQLMDNYYTRVSVKGGAAHWLSVKNVFTSNTHPATWYKWEGRQAEKKALGRRFQRVLKFKEDRTFEELTTQAAIDDFFAERAEEIPPMMWPGVLRNA